MSSTGNFMKRINLISFNKGFNDNIYNILKTTTRGGSKPLNIWDVHTQDGYISRFLDQDIKSMVLEIGGTNVSTTYITCPKGNVVLGITMPFLVMIVKNLKKYFSFEVTILDETSTRRRFRVSNFQSTTQILPLCTAMPIGLSDGWNQIQFNLAEFTRRAYKKQFVEVQKLKINANIRLRRIYFTERLLPDDELPPEYKLYFPLPTKGAKDKKTLAQEMGNKENVKPSTSQQQMKPADGVEIVEKAKSETKVLKTFSKASIHSVKKISSTASRKPSKIISQPTSEAKIATNNETTDKPEEVSDVANQNDVETSENVNAEAPTETKDIEESKEPTDNKDTVETNDTAEQPGDSTGAEITTEQEAEPTTTAEQPAET